MTRWWEDPFERKRWWEWEDTPEKAMLCVVVGLLLGFGLLGLVALCL